MGLNTCQVLENALVRKLESVQNHIEFLDGRLMGIHSLLNILDSTMFDKMVRLQDSIITVSYLQEYTIFFLGVLTAGIIPYAVWRVLKAAMRVRQGEAKVSGTKVCYPQCE